MKEGGGGREEGEREGGRRGEGVLRLWYILTHHTGRNLVICSVLVCILCAAVCGGSEVAKMCTRCRGGRDRDRRGEEGRDGDRRGEDCVPHAV